MSEEIQNNVPIVEEPTPMEQAPVAEVPIEPAPTIDPLSQPVIVPSAGSGQVDRRTLLRKALEAIQFRKKAKMEKIMQFVQEKSSISNDQVEKLLHISDATAGRYLKALVQQNRLKIVGEGNSRRYESPGGSIPIN